MRGLPRYREWRDSMMNLSRNQFRAGVGMKRIAPWILAGLALSCAPRPATDTKGGDQPDPDINPVVASKTLPVPDLLEQRLDAALKHIRERDLLHSHGFWTVFHGILGCGPGITLLDEKKNERINAFDFISSGGHIEGIDFRPTLHGVEVITVPGSGFAQGHQDQFVAEMVQWAMPLDRKMVVAKKDFTFRDFCNHSKMQASLTRKQELSWAIIIVAEHFGTDHAWTNGFGEKMTLEDIVRYELDQPIESAACGGTHRLFGLTWAYHRHMERGGKKEGVWKDIEAKLSRYKDQAKKMRLSDGSLSTDYFAGIGNNKALAARIGSTGHILEWLALAMTDEELKQPWVQEVASSLCLMILQNAGSPIDGGGLYHATHGLYMYRARAFGGERPAGLTMPPPPKG